MALVFKKSKSCWTAVSTISAALIVFSVLTPSASMAQAGPLFAEPALGFSIHAFPTIVKSADLNGDGYQDLIWISNRNINSTTHDDLSIMLGNGDGSFQARASLELPYAAYQMTVVDLDGAGGPDIVVSSASTNEHHYLLGNGDGTLGSIAVLSLGATFARIELAHFDADGNVDLVGYTSGSALLTLYTGNGDGTFQFSSTFDPTGSSATIPAIGDINGDGAVDLLTFGEPGLITASLGNGDGTFQTGVLFPAAAGGTCGITTLADVDGDGSDDIICVGSLTLLHVSISNGDGTFKLPVATTAGLNPFGGSTGDFNQDGNLDFITNEELTQYVNFLAGNGDGTFQPAQPILVGDYPWSIFATDFDGDGLLDLTTANQSSKDITVKLGNGDGTFQGLSASSTGIGVRAVTVADVDENSVPDMILSGSGNSTPIGLALGNGDGSFQPMASLPVSQTPGSVSVADFNGDGSKDLLAVRNIISDLELLVGNGDGTFQPSTVARSAVSGREMVHADFDHDGSEDIAVLTLGQVDIYRGNGDGTFQSPAGYPVGNLSLSIAKADLNNDGTADLVTANRDDNDVTVLLGNGDGTFQSAVSYAVDVRPTSVALGDLDGDGIVDLVTNSQNFRVTILLGLGDGSFGSPTNINVFWIAGGVAISDFDGDGLSDIAVRINHASIGILKGHGDATFDAIENYRAYSSGLTVADLDRDGANDIISTDVFYTDEDLQILMGTRFSLDFVEVGDPGNPPDPVTTKGSVGELFSISRTEITIAQYVKFLNAIAGTDTNGLWDPLMQTDPNAGITRTGTAGSWRYHVQPGRARIPMTLVSLVDAMRFTNWLHNHRPTGIQDSSTTEDGAYTITALGIANNSIVRTSTPRFAIPNEDEWYKAAYFDSQTASYFAYPTGSNSAPECAVPGLQSDIANCVGAGGESENVGVYPGSQSPFGTSDQAGNVEEWTDTIGAGGIGRVVRGGAFDGTPAQAERNALGTAAATERVASRGFRVVPEPDSRALVVVGVLALTALLQRRRRVSSR